MWNYTIASAALAEDSDGEAQAEADGEVHRRLVERPGGGATTECLSDMIYEIFVTQAAKN